jgi:hypothetical protein
MILPSGIRIRLVANFRNEKVRYKVEVGSVEKPRQRDPMDQGK